MTNLKGLVTRSSSDILGGWSRVRREGLVSELEGLRNEPALSFFPEGVNQRMGKLFKWKEVHGSLISGSSLMLVV